MKFRSLKMKNPAKVEQSRALKKQIKARKLHIAKRREFTWEFQWGHELPTKQGLGA